MCNQIEKYRKEAGLSQTELGAPVGWKQSRISNYERSDRTPDIDDARTIVLAFAAHGVEVTLDDLFPLAAA